MSDVELRNAAEHAAEEIRQLRRTNEIYAAKVEMIELFACLLHTTPARRAEGQKEDIAWRLDRAVAAFDDQLAGPDA